MLLRAASLIALAVVAVGCRIGFSERVGEDAASDAAIDAAPPLVARGVLVRYFLDEAAAGQAETTVHDAIAPGFDLAMTYDTPADPLWTARTTGRGLAFPAVELDGGACAPAGGKLLSALGGSGTGTIEVVVDVSEGSLSGSRFLHVGMDQEWGFSLGYRTVGGPEQLWFSSMLTSTGMQDGYEFFPIALATRGRTVLTLVYDTSLAAISERIRLFADGVPVARDAGISTSALPQGDTLGLRTDMHVCIGNRFVGDRTPNGMIAYAAYYTSALTPAEIMANAARLAAWDDP